MTASSDRCRFVQIILAACILFACVSAANAQSLSELNRRLDEIAPQASEGLSSPEAASTAIDQLDRVEADFAQIVDAGREDRADLLATYGRLESVLNRLYQTYQKRKDDCVETIDNGGSCDYDRPEQLALRAVYPLSWLRFEGAQLYSGSPATAERLLNQAITASPTAHY